MSHVPSDEQLMAAWHGGDAKAGAALVERYFSPVFRFFAAKTPDAAEELTQRTFLGCLESWERLPDEPSSFAGYLFGTARNQLYRYFAERRKADDQTDLSGLSLQGLGAGPSTVAAHAEEQRLLLRALRQIPLDHQITLELFYWEELSVADIARALGVAAGTVKSRLHRAREMLRERVTALASSDPVRDSTLGNFDRWATGLRELLGPEDNSD